MQIDHIVPKAGGGMDIIKNLVPARPIINNRKSDKMDPGITQRFLDLNELIYAKRVADRYGQLSIAQARKLKRPKQKPIPKKVSISQQSLGYIQVTGGKLVDHVVQKVNGGHITVDKIRLMPLSDMNVALTKFRANSIVYCKPQNEDYIMELQLDRATSNDLIESSDDYKIFDKHDNLFQGNIHGLSLKTHAIVLSIIEDKVTGKVKIKFMLCNPFLNPDSSGFQYFEEIRMKAMQLI